MCSGYILAANAVSDRDRMSRNIVTSDWIQTEALKG